MLPENRVLKCQLLFPTVERLALSKQGKSATPLLQYLRWLAPLFIYPVSFLPDKVLDYVLQWYFKDSTPECAVGATKSLISSGAIRTITNMAHEEMQNVVKADYDLIQKHLDKLWFYYGASDHWCPVEYYEDMKLRFSSGDIQLCKENFDHAFVLNDSDGMAKIAWKWACDNVISSKNM